MKVARIALAIAGIVLVLYGGGRILFSVPPPILVVLGVWMVGALLIQHGVVSPLVVAVGAALRRVPDRGRRYLQIGLLVAAMVTVVAIPLTVRQGTQPPAKALLLQNYAANLAMLLVLIAVVTLVAYAVHMARDRRGPESDASSALL